MEYCKYCGVPGPSHSNDRECVSGLFEYFEEDIFKKQGKILKMVNKLQQKLAETDDLDRAKRAEIKAEIKGLRYGMKMLDRLITGLEE